MEQQFKTAFQDPDTGLFEVSGKPKKYLTEAELKKLQNLMPNVEWFIVHWAKPNELSTQKHT